MPVEDCVLSSQAVRNELVSCLPNLRAFAISLCGDVHRADDLVQDTMLKAWKHLDGYTEGTNMRAWLFTILRNTFLSEMRRRRNPELSLDAEPHYADQFGVEPEQHGWLDRDDMRRALAMLNPNQRTAILLVGAEGLTYDEAAAICNCPAGTIKSRVNRARLRLIELLGLDLDESPRPELGALLEGTPPRTVQPSAADRHRIDPTSPVGSPPRHVALPPTGAPDRAPMYAAAIRQSTQETADCA